MRKLVFVILLLLAIGAPTANAVVKPVKPPKPPKPAICKKVPTHPQCLDVPAPKPAVYAVVTSTAVEYHATNMQPGLCPYFVFEVWGLGNPYSYWRGGSAGCVRPDGNYTVSESLDEIRSWAAPYELYEVEIWLYLPPDSTVLANLDGVSSKIEVEFG